MVFGRSAQFSFKLYKSTLNRNIVCLGPNSFEEKKHIRDIYHGWFLYDLFDIDGN